MKLVKSASGKTTIKMSKSEWQGIGKRAGWIKKANHDEDQKPMGRDWVKLCTICETFNDGQFSNCPECGIPCTPFTCSKWVKAPSGEHIYRQPRSDSDDANESFEYLNS